MNKQSIDPSSKRHGLLNDLYSEWRKSWLDVFRSTEISSDILAGITTAAVAIPLNIALAVVCGLPPITGLLAGAVGGFIAACFGGSTFQVTGPAAALNVMVLALNLTYGPGGVAAACLIIGVVQILLVSVSAGGLIRYVPEALLAGFTTGVGIKILDNQIPELLGFDYRFMEIAGMLNKPAWLYDVSWLAFVSGLLVAFLVVACRDYKRFPAALVGIALVTAISVHLNWSLERVGAISSAFPPLKFPELMPSHWTPLIVASLPLAVLAAIESLLSAQAIDRMTKGAHPHNSNLELFGQGLANLGCGLIGAMPVSGVVVRSTVNVQSGAKTKLASALHAAILFAAIFYLSDMMAMIPLSALAGLLCTVGWRLVEIRTIIHLCQKHKFEALAFLLACFGTVTGYLLSGLIAGGICSYLSHKFAGRHRLNVESELKPKVNSNRNGQIRAIIPQRAGVQANRLDHYSHGEANANWLLQIKERAQVAASSFVHHKASVIGRVVLGEHVHIAAESSVRADEGSPFFIGSNSNIQDGVVVHALKEKWVNVAGADWAVYISQNVSIAHQALIHGPCFIGENTFIGFKAVVHDSVLGDHCFIGIGSIVVGVEIPSHRFVPNGMVVDSQDKVDLLPPVTDMHLHFNEDVVGVNKGLAAAYNRHSTKPRSSQRKPFLELPKQIGLNRF